jgi:cystathionine beta-lyase/cystathionine gamma-synthase
VFDRLRVIRRAASLGGVESLCSLPVLTSHYRWPQAALREAGISEAMLRVSVGLEDEQQLIADLEQALE